MEMNADCIFWYCGDDYYLVWSYHALLPGFQLGKKEKGKVGFQVFFFFYIVAYLIGKSELGLGNMEEMLF